MLVAVYGTLKKGYGNHHYLENQKFVGRGRTKKHLTMIDSGFPVVIHRWSAKKKQHQVQVEVYDIGADQECLVRLDRLEGQGYMYHRVVQTILMDDGRKLECSIYIGDDRWLRQYRPADTKKFLRRIGSDDLLVWPTIERDLANRMDLQRQQRDKAFRTRMPRTGEQEDTGA